MDKCEFCSNGFGLKEAQLKPCANGILISNPCFGRVGKTDNFGMVIFDGVEDLGYLDFDYCPFCGKKQERVNEQNGL